MKIDIFAHILPANYKNALLKTLPSKFSWEALENPVLSDLGKRFEIMDKFESLAQVLTLPPPPVEYIAKPEKAAELARIANDDLAELVAKYPERFVAGIACLPMNDIDNTLNEVARAIKDLNLKGVQIYCPTNDKPLDSSEFLPLYERMSQYNLPIFLHPFRTQNTADYKAESSSKYLIYHIFGWPYETSTAMARLTFSGILEKFNNLKIVCHHNGAMIPFFESRILDQQFRKQMDKPVYAELKRPPIEYFRMFYVDTVTRTIPALMCTYHFFNAEHMLFGTDMPYGVQFGLNSIQQGINGIQDMNITAREKQMLLEENARRLLCLPA